MLSGAQYETASFPFAILLCTKLMVVLNGIFAWGLWARSQDAAMLWISIIVSAFCLGNYLIFIPLYGMMAAATVSLLGETLILALTFWVAWRGVRKVRATGS